LRTQDTAFAARRAAASAGSSSDLCAKIGASGRDQQNVAFAYRNCQLFGEMQHHLAAGLRAAGLDETQVPRGNLCLVGERKLTHVATLPPFAQQIADRIACCFHRSTLTQAPERFHYLAGNAAAEIRRADMQPLALECNSEVSVKAS
jgi:hypothetical protein